MRTRLEQNQNKLILDIPGDYASLLHLTADTEVEVALQDGSITVTPVLRLADLLERVNPENVHAAFETGTGSGGEIW